VGDEIMRRAVAQGLTGSIRQNPVTRRIIIRTQGDGAESFVQNVIPEVVEFETKKVDAKR
jgi:hypothetical protein